MNKIKLQELTPEVYYNQSRDFQFIGRLFDVVLNSVKNNSENLYNLPLNEYTDEKLIDLMTMTLGFKSRHSYNVKQLVSLCSAFCTVIKNKGNIQSIILAVRALLNAEGIKEDVSYSFAENNTVLLLYVPQELTDLNLIRDLLEYILPAGMSCNLIRSFRITSPSTTIHNEQAVISWEKVETAEQAVPQITADSSSGIFDPIADALAKNKQGLIANTLIYQGPVATKETKVTKTTRKRK